MTVIREKNGRIEPSGPTPKRFGGALNAELPDELVTKQQFESSVGVQTSEFFGNVTGTTVTLANAPITSNLILVGVDYGLGSLSIANPSSYSVNGNILTFSPALSSNDVVVFYSYRP